MKNVFRIGMFLFLVNQLHGQIVPNNFKVKVSYDLEVTTFKQISANEDISRLNDFEKLSFRPISEQKHIDNFLGYQNEIATVFTYGKINGGEGTTQGSLARLIVDENGSFSFDASGRMIDRQPVSETAARMNAELKQDMDASTFLKFPEISSPSPDAIREAQANGYIVTTTEGIFSVKGPAGEFTYDTQRKVVEHKEFQDGRPSFTLQEFYAVDGRGQKIPTVKIETTYEFSSAGLLIEVVRIETITNYSRIVN